MSQELINDCWQIGLGNGLGLSGSNPSSDPMLTSFHDAIYYQLSPGASELTLFTGKFLLCLGTKHLDAWLSFWAHSNPLKYLVKSHLNLWNEPWNKLWESNLCCGMFPGKSVSQGLKILPLWCATSLLLPWQLHHKGPVPRSVCQKHFSCDIFTSDVTYLLSTNIHLLVWCGVENFPLCKSTLLCSQCIVCSCFGNIWNPMLLLILTVKSLI